MVIGFIIIGEWPSIKNLSINLMSSNRRYDVILSSADPLEGILTVIFSYLMMQALAELAVMYPINGAFTMYICRFIDPSWGFACGWQYGLGWLTVLPFEISAACNVRTFRAMLYKI